MVQSEQVPICVITLLYIHSIPMGMYWFWQLLPMLFIHSTQMYHNVTEMHSNTPKLHETGWHNGPKLEICYSIFENTIAAVQDDGFCSIFLSSLIPDFQMLSLPDVKERNLHVMSWAEQ